MPNVWVSQTALDTHRDKIYQGLSVLFHEGASYDDNVNDHREALAAHVGLSVAYTRKLLVGYGIILPKREHRKKNEPTNMPDLVMASAQNMYLVLHRKNNKWVTVYDAGNSEVVAAAFMAGFRYANSCR